MTTKKAAGLLTLEHIRTASDIASEDVYVPEWGGTVRVRGLTARERDTFEAAMVQARGKSTSVNMRDARARMVTLTAIDETGAHLFTADDIGWLGDKSAAALDRLFEVASRLSGIGDTDMEELAGNSDADQSDASPSD